MLDLVLIPMNENPQPFSPLAQNRKHKKEVGSKNSDIPLLSHADDRRLPRQKSKTRPPRPPP